MTNFKSFNKFYKSGSWDQSDRTLQFSTSKLSSVVKMLQSVFLGYQFFSKTARPILLIFGTKLDNNKTKKITKPDFRKKIWIIQKFRKICIFEGFFELLSKTTLTISLIFSQNLEINPLNHHAKFRADTKISRRNIHPQSSYFWSKRP